MKKRLLIRFRREDEEKLHSAFTSNIGPSGIFVVSANIEEGEVGKSLWLEIEMPDQSTLLLRGKVVWIRKVPVEIRSMQQNGFAVNLTEAPEQWYHLFMSKTSS